MKKLLLATALCFVGTFAQANTITCDEVSTQFIYMNLQDEIGAVNRVLRSMESITVLFEKYQGELGDATEEETDTLSAYMMNMMLFSLKYETELDEDIALLMAAVLFGDEYDVTENPAKNAEKYELLKTGLRAKIKECVGK